MILKWLLGIDYCKNFIFTSDQCSKMKWNIVCRQFHVKLKMHALHKSTTVLLVNFSLSKNDYLLHCLFQKVLSVSATHENNISHSFFNIVTCLSMVSVVACALNAIETHFRCFTIQLFISFIWGIAREEKSSDRWPPFEETISCRLKVLFFCYFSLSIYRSFTTPTKVLSS